MSSTILHKYGRRHRTLMKSKTHLNQMFSNSETHSKPLTMDEYSLKFLLNNFQIAKFNFSKFRKVENTSKTEFFIGKFQAIKKNLFSNALKSTS